MYFSPLMSPVRIAVFASHRGSNFQALHTALASMTEPPARVVLCLSNNLHPGAFEYAAANGIETLRLSPTAYSDPMRYDADLFDALRSREIDMVVLAGYMRRLPELVVNAWQGRVLNVHPALLPKFGGQGMYGMRVHQAVIDAGETESGATVHVVDADYDTGPIVAQERVPVRSDDTPETLAARVLQAEHRLLPRVVIEMAEGMLKNEE